MEVKYRRELNETYMILGEETSCEGFALEILKNNRLERLMPLTVFETDGIPSYYFQITRGNSLFAMLAKRQITLEEIRQLIFSLCRTVEEMEKYLLEPDHLILEPEFIYGLPDCSRVIFCCHPAFKKDFFVQIQNLIQYFLEKLDHSDKRSVETAYDLFQVSRQEHFRFEDLLEVVGREPQRAEPAENIHEPPGKGEGEEELWNFSAEPGEKRKEDENAGFPIFALILFGLSAVLMGTGIRGLLRGRADWKYFAAAGILSVMGVGRMLIPWILKRRVDADSGILPEAPEAPAVPCGRRWEEETDGETQLLGNFAPSEKRVLVSGNPGRYESIPMDRMPLVIGKNRESSDYILNFPSISRMHARLEEQGGYFFLTDCDSTNGTYLNGVRLEAGRRCLLNEGDEVKLADLKYIFR